MSRTFLLVATIVLFAASASTGQADVTVERVGDDLYVDGSASGDSVEIYQYYDSVQVYDHVAGTTYGPYYGLDNVWVDTGDGNDYVEGDSHTGQILAGYPAITLLRAQGCQRQT